MDSAVTGIKVLRGCGASGVSLTAGTVYAVPAQVSEADAMILIRLKKAEPVELWAKSKKPKARGDGAD